MVRQKRSKGKTKVGRVNIEIHSGSYRLRFTDPLGNRKAIAVCPVDTEGAYKKAELVAKQIDSDMAKHKLGMLDIYDPTLNKYRPGYVPVKERVTLWDYWDDYKRRNCDRVSKSRQAVSWKMVNRVFIKAGTNGTHDKFIAAAKEMYSGESLKMIQTDINASLEGSDVKLIRFDKPRKDYSRNSRSKEIWSQQEVSLIRNAFKENRYSKNSYYRHSYYYPYVSFLALTGCRPEEAIALTWDDITDEGILINKVFVSGQLEQKTKTSKDRVIPVNKQLRDIIEQYCRKQRKLLFPTPTAPDSDCLHISDYLNHKSFSQRVFKKVISALHEEGLISKKLPPYSLRNSWITLMLKKGLDLATVAKLAGTSEKMILQHYWGADDSVVIPEI